MFDIFEQPWTLLVVAVLIFLVMLIFRRIPHQLSLGSRRSIKSPLAMLRGSRLIGAGRHWWQWLLPALFVMAAFGLDLLVQTDTEKINAVINTGVKAVEEENCNAIETIISDNYRDSYHNTKEDLMYDCRANLSEPLVEKNIKRILSIEISPPKATVILTVRIVFDKRSYVYQDFKRLMLTKLKLDLQKEQVQPKLEIANQKSKINRWFINRAEILEIDRQPVKWQDIKQPNW